VTKRRGPNGEDLERERGISYDPVKKRFKVYGKHGGKTLTDAKRKRRDLDREAKGTKLHALAAYFDHWANWQARKGRRNIKKDRRRLELHVEPTFGRRSLTDPTPPEFLELYWNLYDSGDGVIGARTIRDINGLISSVYSLAVFEGKADYNPATQMPYGSMPKVGDNPWPKYEPEEVAALLTDERIRLDRRVLYALLFWFADREGEGCGFTFADYDRTRKPLGSMVIDKQYQGQPLKGSRDDYVAVRRFPAHSEAARIVAEWKISGFASMLGRPPRDDDPIVPNPRDMKARKPNAVYKALIEDEKRIGIEHKKGRATHGFRKCWISMAHEADANREAVRVLTHTGRSRDVLDRYALWSWDKLCETVQLVQLPTTAQVIAFGGRSA
jgi:hypothetical protein